MTIYFKLYHAPGRKTLALPRAVLQLSGLSEAEELGLRLESGCVLLTRNRLTAGECGRVIRLLLSTATMLTGRLARASREVPETRRTGSVAVGGDGPFCGLDDRFLLLLLSAGADPEGLRLLLTLEGAEDE